MMLTFMEVVSAIWASLIKIEFILGNYLGNRFIKVETPMTPRAVLPSATAAPRGPGTEEEDKKGGGRRPAADKLVQPPGCRTVFVKNLPYDCSEERLQEAFKVYGKISSVRIARWNHTNQSKGFGYVEFFAENSANIAVRKSGDVVLSGRLTMCDFDTGRVKGSFRSPAAAAAASSSTPGTPGMQTGGSNDRGFKRLKTT
jgi:nucleolin